MLPSEKKDEGGETFASVHIALPPLPPPTPLYICFGAKGERGGI